MQQRECVTYVYGVLLILLTVLTQLKKEKTQGGRKRTGKWDSDQLAV
jgi:hypothetical protein